VRLILLALAALLLAVLGSRSRPQRHPFTGRPTAAGSRPFPLATGNGRHPHTGIRDPYLDSLTEGRR
jgi:hypothetical protein